MGIVGLTGVVFCIIAIQVNRKRDLIDVELRAKLNQLMIINHSSVVLAFIGCLCALLSYQLL